MIGVNISSVHKKEHLGLNAFCLQEKSGEKVNTVNVPNIMNRFGRAGLVRLLEFEILKK